MTLAVKPGAVPLETIRGHAQEVDQAGRFPAEAVDALRSAGLLGIGIPETYGGPGGSIAETATAVEQVATGCASAAMVYTMHIVAGQTLLAGTTGPDDGIKADTLRAIARGEHLSTLAYSERGSRSHFWAQTSRARRDGSEVLIDADKTFVTSAGHADSYITATGSVDGTAPTETELYLIDADEAGIQVHGPFDGLGMRGNASSPVAYREVHVDGGRRLGAPGSGFQLMMTATLPWFVVCSAATSVGIAGAALEAGADHISGARFAHLGSTLADVPGVRARLAEARIRHMQARALLFEVARLIETGSPDAQLGVLALKAATAEMAIDVTDEVMRACGGAAFSRQLGIERQFRDARAASVMAPTTDVLRDLMGKALTGMELFG